MLELWEHGAYLSKRPARGRVWSRPGREIFDLATTTFLEEWKEGAIRVVPEENQPRYIGGGGANLLDEASGC